MRYFLVFGFMLVSTLCYSQSDRLQPVPDYFSMPHYDSAYYPFVRKHLIKGLSPIPVARVLMLHAFAPEEVISIERKGESYNLIHKRCEESIWTAENREDVKTEKSQTPLDSSFALLLEKVFLKKTLEVRYPHEWTGGYDASLYIYSVFDRRKGLQSGEIWSPTVGAKMQMLAELTDDLIRLVHVTESNRAKIKTEIETLAKKLLY